MSTTLRRQLEVHQLVHHKLNRAFFSNLFDALFWCFQQKSKFIPQDIKESNMTGEWWK
jgi:hypothetical protein